MKIQTKFNLAIVIIFVILAVGIGVMGVSYFETYTIREAENRVRIYARAAWEIHDSRIDRIRSVAEILARDRLVRDFLRDPGDAQVAGDAAAYLESFRQDQGIDILNVLTPNGVVLMRTRFPYADGDSLVGDPMIRQVMLNRQSCSGNVVFELERLDVEGEGLVERCLAVGGEPRGMLIGTAVPVFDGGSIVGMVQALSLLNGTVAEVDKIRDAVFANEVYNGKPVGTATIFMGDMRISTNVLDGQGRRAVGTRASKEVTDRVLGEGLSWMGRRALVVDTWYLSRYDPIRDPDGKVIGMLYVGELEQKYLDMRTQAVVLYLSVVIAGMFLAFMIFFFLIKSILKPIRQLSEATRCLSSGDLTYRVGVRGKDEVGELLASFNLMAEQLAEQRGELERRHEHLEEVSRELRVINESYMDMLGFVTHQLKNPLGSATMSLYTVKDGYLGELNPAQKRSLDLVAQSLDYFHDMIKNYLDLSRLEKGELEVHRGKVVLCSQVIAPVLEGFEREVRERRMEVENGVPPDLVLDTDGSLLRAVYDNLISNAIKYGREGGRIVLDAQHNRDHVTLSVWNEGEGVPPDEMSGLFKKFSRLDAAVSTGKKGSGLGLYICKEIVERLGGEVWADSKVGEWVKFSFTLPAGAIGL